MMRAIPFLFTAVLAPITMLVGCTQTVSKPEPEPEPMMEQPPATALQGRWTSSEDWWEEDANGVDRVVGTRYKTLTLTKSRWIYGQAEVRVDGRLEDEWWNSGTWESTADSITRIEQEWDDEEESLSEPVRVTKKYYWTNTDRTAMVIQDWVSGSDNESDHFLYSKMEPVDVNGTWRFSRYNDDDGFDQTWTISVTDSRFSYQYLTDQDPPHQFDMTGTATHDSDELTLSVIVTNTTTQDGGEVVGTGFWVGETLRFAYAPSYDDMTIRVSQMWDELVRVDGMWMEGHPEFPYGNYWMYFQRVPQ